MKKYKIQKSPFVIPTTDGKLIEEHFGHTTENGELSLAHMIAPAGWSEPFQTPKFDEYTYIIRGKKQINIDGELITLEAGQSIKISKGVKIKYSNPFDTECEYIAVCLPAFSIGLVNREEDEKI
ncbi:cupin domain-containing protein [Lutibacter sp.]|uniref:cupin domain-containing protein n=1 Tax=Lutibacter sp. TaxID=1925666 RepID=UPI00356758BE